jgi:hypothetical protein
MNTKKCGTCKKEKPFEDFGIKKAARDGRQSACKICRNTYLKKWYKDNKQLHIKRVEVTKNDRKNRAREFVREYLSDKKCTDCSENRAIVLEFDHLSDKDENISKLVQWGASNARILKEISKCEVVCANCHRIRTFTRMNNYRLYW